MSSPLSLFLIEDNKMSVVIQVKGIILANLNSIDPKLKKAVMNFLNALDSDLDVGGYVPSSEVDNAIEDLDKALVEIDEPEESSKLIDEEEEIDSGYSERVLKDGEDEED